MITKAAITRMKKARKTGTLVIVKHFTDGQATCDICGKKNASWAVAICKTPKEASADFETVGSVYLNGEAYLVGSVCLKDLKKRLEKL